MGVFILVVIGIVVVILAIIGIVKLIGWLMEFTGTDFSRPTPIERRYREIQENQQREQLYAQQQHQAQEQAANQRDLQAYRDKYWCHHIVRGSKHCSFGASPKSRTTYYGGDEEVHWNDFDAYPENMYICDDCNQWFCFAHIAELRGALSNPESLYGARSGLCYKCAVARREG